MNLITMKKAAALCDSLKINFKRCGNELMLQNAKICYCHHSIISWAKRRESALLIGQAAKQHHQLAQLPGLHRKPAEAMMGWEPRCISLTWMWQLYVSTCT